MYPLETPWFYWGFRILGCTLREAFLAVFSQISLTWFKVFDIISYVESYRSGHNEAVLKNSRYCHCKIVKTLDFIGVFVGSSARCEKRFSQFSRKFLAGFSQFPNVFEPILNWFGDYLGQFNSLRRHIEAVITRLSWKQFGSESPRGFESLCLRHMKTPLKSEPSKFEWQWCLLIFPFI